MISKNAITSMLYEVSASPKPGLVDRYNSGAHTDMDFFSFMASSATLYPYFLRCAEEGEKFKEEDLKGLFQNLRLPGIKAEREMYKATKGANTHKGLIFSLGIVCAAAAYNFRNNGTDNVAGNPVRAEEIKRDSIFVTISSMTKGLCERELEHMNPEKTLTNGEKIYMQYGVKGIRGEVEMGFPTVRDCSIPIYEKLVSEEKVSLNDALVQTLLGIMEINDDTNILSRHDMDTLDYVKRYSGDTLRKGGMLTPEGRRAVEEMDRDFISRNISPGGSADLLAVTIMLHLLN